MSDEQWSKKMQSPSRNIHIYKCVLVCAWFVLSHRSTWCGGGANRERNRQIVVALMCAQSSVNRIHARWKEQKKSSIIGQLSLCKPLQWDECACVFLACAHSVMCAGYQVVDQEERWSRETRFLSHPQGGQTTDTHLKGNKTAPTTSKSCCILFSSEETRVIRSPPPICSPYV